jgi:hypothetical protein
VAGLEANGLRVLRLPAALVTQQVSVALQLVTSALRA